MESANGDTWRAQAYPSAVFRQTYAGLYWDEIFRVPSGQLVGLHPHRDGGLLATTDLGEAWVSDRTGTEWQRSKKGPETPINGIDWMGEELAVAVADDGVLLRTVDGGAHWKRVATGVKEDLIGVSFITSQQVWVSGDDGRLLRSADAGAAWRPIVSGTKSKLNHVMFDEQGLNGWAVGEGTTLARSRNGGLRWYEERRPTEIPMEFIRVQIDLSQLTLVSAQGHQVVSQDEGEHWELGAPLVVDQSAVLPGAQGPRNRLASQVGGEWLLSGESPPLYSHRDQFPSTK